jgi:hypothetical protein
VEDDVTRGALVTAAKDQLRLRAEEAETVPWLDDHATTSN